MSKDLEKEYRALMDSDVPDLWARIEAGIDEKKVPDNLHSFDYKTQNSEKRRTKKRRFHYGVWGTVAAACLCVAVAVPVTMQASKGRTDNMAAVPEAGAENFAVGYAQDDAAMKSADTDLFNHALEDSVAMEAENAAADMAEQAQVYTKETIRGWFDGTAEPEMDWDAEPVWAEDGSLYYLPVKDQSMYDLKSFLSQYFDADEVEELLNAEIEGHMPFMEVDGVLYHGAGMTESD